MKTMYDGEQCHQEEQSNVFKTNYSSMKLTVKRRQNNDVIIKYKLKYLHRSSDNSQ